jgi:hypothetical protein
MIYDNAPTVGLVAEAHGRMPVPSAADHIEPWLNGGADLELLSRAPNNLLQHWPAPKRDIARGLQTREGSTLIHRMEEIEQPNLPAPPYFLTRARCVICTDRFVVVWARSVLDPIHTKRLKRRAPTREEGGQKRSQPNR